MKKNHLVSTSKQGKDEVSFFKKRHFMLSLKLYRLMKTSLLKNALASLFAFFLFAQLVNSQSVLSYGDCIVDSIEEFNDHDIFTIAVEAGDRVIIRASSTMQVEIELRTSAGVVIASSVFSEAVIDESVQTAGDYLIRVSEWQGDGTGTYHLSVQRGFIPPDAIPIPCDFNMEGSVTCETDMMAYVFSVAANTLVLITASAPALQVRIELRDSIGNLLATAVFSQAEIEITLENAGCYTILVNEWQGDNTGSFNLHVSVIVGECSGDCSNIPPSEICGNSIDDDGDLLIDCADPSCAAPAINSIPAINPGCQGMTNNGSISINTSGVNLEFSINNGQNWQPSPVFQNLEAGSYDVLVRNSSSGCETPWQNNPVILGLDTNCPEICGNSMDDDGDTLFDCDDIADCVPVITSVAKANPAPPNFDNGQIVVNANGQNLEFSINSGQTWQTSNVFTGLSPGSFNIRVRNSMGGCFADYTGNPVVLTDAPPLCEAPVFNWLNLPESTCAGSPLTLCIAQTDLNFNYELVRDMAPTGHILSGSGLDACFPPTTLQAATEFNVVASLKTDPACFFILDEIEILLGGLSIDTLTKDESIDENDGEIYLCMESGTAPFTVEWEPQRGRITDSLQVLCFDNNFEIIGLRAGVYVINVTDAESCSGSVVVKVNSPNRQRIGFPEKPLLTPNGDGKNDELVFTGILLYPGDATELTIYNRYGSVLFEGPATTYDHLWDATWDGELVPSDTYFYTLRIFTEGDEVVYTGFITVVR